MVRAFIVFIFSVALVSCSKNQAEQCNNDSDCPSGEICNLETNKCQECTPECTGKCCGDDGCGGTCQDECSSGSICNQTSCVCEQCTTSCDGKCCGDDGCGGICPDNCTSEGKNCNQTSCTCECIPNCESKCCGDDGCGGTCPDECGIEGMVCISATCNCSEPGKLGDPCPYENLHLDKPGCRTDEDEFCQGIAADNDWLTCPNGTDEECATYLELAWNPVCVNGFCGGSLCTKECKRLCDCCPHGFYPKGVRGQPYYCWPGVTEQPGDVCPFTDVNSCFDSCAMGTTCVGSEPSALLGICPMGYFWECDDYIPPNFHPDCIDGLCGFGVCVEDCVNGACDQYYKPTDISGHCFCFPIPEPGIEGMPCELGYVNILWGACETGLTCVGLPADGSNGACPNGIPDCSSIPSSWNRSCSYETNLCGASFCVKECDAGACEAGFIPFDYGGTCYCAPEG